MYFKWLQRVFGKTRKSSKTKKNKTKRRRMKGG